jgi:hypothetical protein
MDSPSEERGIRVAIGHYAEGMRTGHVETLKEAFHEQAILCGYLGDELIAAPIVALYDWVGGNPAPAASGQPFDCEVLEIKITNRVATASVRETDQHGAVIDHFHLLKVSERWWIVSKLWDASP